MLPIKGFFLGQDIEVPLRLTPDFCKTSFI